jgi:tetratricopeptide (TPR) repeat protein
MDWVDGAPLDRYASERNLTVANTLRLFATICDAVSAAHVRGIIHRDLKPGNILVDEGGAPHVLDFGLAKLDDREQSSAAHGEGDDGLRAGDKYTRSGQFLGSLPWTSPEQAAGHSESVDVRSDVYSIGVMLFRTLTGVFPYEVSGTLREVLDHIVERPARRPSSVRPDLDADIDAMLLTCLAKEPARRYQSAGELAADLRRYLNGEPIAARPPHAVYLLRKFVQRNRLLVTSFAAALACLVLGLVGTIWKAVGEQRQRELAEREISKVRAINNVLESILISPDPFFGAGPDATVGQVMEKISGGLSQQLRDEPEVEADVRLTLANSFRHMGRPAQAEENLWRGIELRRSLFGEADPRTLEPYVILAYLREGQGQLEDAESLFRRVVDGLRAANGPDDPDVLIYSAHHGGALRKLGRLEEAKEVLTTTLERDRAVFGEKDGRTLYAAQQLARVWSRSGRFTEAEELIREVIDARRKTLGNDHPSTQVAIAANATILWDAGRLDEAEAALSAAVEALELRLGPTHQTVRHARGELTKRRDDITQTTVSDSKGDAASSP